MFMLTKAWNSIPGQTFINCFKKSGISDETKMRELNDDEDDLFQGLDVKEDVMENLKDDLGLLKTKFNVDCDITANELVDLSLQIFLDVMSTLRKNPMKRTFLTMLQNHVLMKQWMLSLYSRITVSFPSLELI